MGRSAFRISPNGGVVWRLADGWSWRWAAERAATVPTLQQSYLPRWRPEDGLIMPDPALGPERTTTIETSLIHPFTTRAWVENRFRLPAQSRTDGRLTWRPSESWEAWCEVENIADRRLIRVRGDDDRFWFASGRRVRFGIKRQW
jgi:outer membrane receptor protein involved in Fe transport